MERRLETTKFLTYLSLRPDRSGFKATGALSVGQDARPAGNRVQFYRAALN